MALTYADGWNTIQDMYGKHFGSMYEGSMVGAGSVVFAVWGYVIAKAFDSTVELNPRLLAAILGDEQWKIEQAIEFLCKPDPDSRTKEHEGRRLIREGQFQYFVPSWQKYHEIRNQLARREGNRLAQARHREKSRLPRPGKPLPGEPQFVKQLAEGQIDHTGIPVAGQDADDPKSGLCSS